jgi:hypothetical protein
MDLFFIQADFFYFSRLPGIIRAQRSHRYVVVPLKKGLSFDLHSGSFSLQPLLSQGSCSEYGLFKPRSGFPGGAPSPAQDDQCVITRDRRAMFRDPLAERQRR